jgi:DNA-binding transcriptional MerR regulator
MAELYPEGFTSQQIVNFFKKHSIRMGEATFRKYVQMGLLPRCRRVGRKGKHRGSRGIYPTKVLKRIITIRDLMDQGYTMDEIKDGMMRFRGRIDDVERSVNELFAEFEKELARGPFQTDRGRRQTAAEELAEARRTAEDLLNRLEGLEKSFTEPRPMAAAEATEELTDTADHKFF